MTIEQYLRPLALGLALALAPAVNAQTSAPTTPAAVPTATPDPAETIDLWPVGALTVPAGLTETVDERSTEAGISDRAVKGISVPRMVVFRPKVPNGDALLITPGGGYKHVVVDKEGYEVARELSAEGVTVFVLFYRLPGEGWEGRSDVPLADAQRAMRLIRARATSYGIDPERVAAMGFSAGGHLCADLATRFDTPVYAPVDAADEQSAKPLFAAPIYPVVSMSAPAAHMGSRHFLIGDEATKAQEEAHSPQFHVTAKVPPVFLLHAENDEAVPVDNSLMLRAALVAHDVPVETHLFEKGGHGFGLRKATGLPVADWLDLFRAFARDHGWQKPDSVHK
ncbi:alpha/beta hydrolase [Gimibacter soli]|uniref:Alpha/beta hydrolase n=1 Tax=Gimibacter soli TaxID=3024400 RepID=A0AAE9XVP0_9PROT|nr:alpha/beta hydrolase [Gimibacter soli]WCL53844.1 alpha/beta hydrolase [Gimibacter soli]